jgi:hypothetical protein
MLSVISVSKQFNGPRRGNYQETCEDRCKQLQGLRSAFPVFKGPPPHHETSTGRRRSLPKHHAEAVDTTTSAGRMVMQMLGSFAEFERSMVRERTRAAWRPRGIAV